MSTEHLSKGSDNPPIQKGKLRLYSMRFCPYVHRVHLVLDAKHIPHDVVFINLSAKPEWYTKLIPTTKVPALIVDNVNLYESLIVSDFLDEKYPDIPLHSNVPIAKAKDRMLIESFDDVSNFMYKLYHQETLDKLLFDKLLTMLEPYEKELSKRGKYFGGKSAGMVDFMIWPWFERLPLLSVLFGPEFTLPEDKCPNLIQWKKLMLEDKAVKKNYLTPEQFAHFLKKRLSGVADYTII